jgi:hypothetical protein
MGDKLSYFRRFVKCEYLFALSEFWNSEYLQRISGVSVRAQSDPAPDFHAHRLSRLLAKESQRSGAKARDQVLWWLGNYPQSHGIKPTLRSYAIAAKCKTQFLDFEEALK